MLHFEYFVDVAWWVVGDWHESVNVVDTGDLPFVHCREISFVSYLMHGEIFRIFRVFFLVCILPWAFFLLLLLIAILDLFGDDL